jgi:non-specific serine/threonine protein kinase
LTGSGGSGKTRLAIQVGMDMLDSFKDGIWWVDLSTITDKKLVIQSIAKSLGVQEAASPPLDEALANNLRSKHLLLIVDNCEHLIDASVQVIEPLLNKCPQLKILTTSRESLSIPGEHIRDVPLMGLPDPQKLPLVDIFLDYEGIQLFIERAGSVNTDLTLTEENASFVAQICSDLDGIPLAIELAAARTRHLSLEQIAVRLNDRFRLLRGSRTAIPRHQTLQTVMDWSYNLLTENECILFQRLAVFSGSWNLDAVEEICSDENINKSEILNILSSLVDKSLVIKAGDWAGKARYRMLETIRQYANIALQKSGDELEIQKHHLDHFSVMVKSANPHLGFFLSDQDMVSWLNILSPELNNIRSALSFCLTHPQYSESGLAIAAKLHWFWLLNNQLLEGHEWIDKFLAKSNSISKSVQALAFLSKGFLSCWRGDFASARPNLEKSLKLFDEIGDKSGISFSLHGLGFAANGVGEPEKAGSLFNKCLKKAREIDDKWLISFALHFIAISSSFQGEHDLARSQFEECINVITDGYGNTQGIAFSKFHLGRISNLQGNYDAAYTHYLEGLQLFRQIGDRRGTGYSMFGFARLAHTLEEPLRAAHLIGITDSIREDLGTLLETPLQIELDRIKSETQEILGVEAFHTAWLNGKNMKLEDAIQYALNPD